MTAFERNTMGKRAQVGLRVVACMVALLLAACCPAQPGLRAFAAESGGTAGTSTGGSTSASSSISAGTPASNVDSPSSSSSASTDKKDDSPSANTDDKEDEERKAKEKEADEKRSAANDLLDQVNALNSTLADIQAEHDAASAALDEANAQRDATLKGLEEETARLESLQSELSDFVVDMYKQGGVTPYLDVMLRSTSYREFLNSWSMATLVSERGEELAAERRQLRDEIAGRLAECDERIAEAERTVKTADSKHKQIEATQLALTVQACDLNVEAAEIVGDEEELAKAKEAAEAARKALDEAIERGLAGESSDVGDGLFANPCPDSTISSGFGYRSFDNAVHKGLDMAASEGAPYYAAESGTVVAATNGGGDNGGAGNWIVIDHGDGLVTKYMHSLVTLVSVGDHVERGQNIGLVGSTGQSTGPHLHFQVEINGTAIDPKTYL